MYVTRRLSAYKSSPSSCSPPEGPNSGILIIQDEDSESRLFFGLMKDPRLMNFPFPQNKYMQLHYAYTKKGVKLKVRFNEYLDGLLIPVINQPLSSNQYYLINYSGKLTGRAFASSKEADKSTWCFRKFAEDVPPQPFDPNNDYQKFEFCISTCWGKPNGFSAKSIAADGIPPEFLGTKGWTVATKKINNLNLTEANGLNPTLRARLPELKSSSSQLLLPAVVVVGKWYCPFIFIREGGFDFETQMKTSMYYEMTLEQKWEKIFECQKNQGDFNSNCVVVDVSVQKQVILGGGVAQSVNVADDVMWVSPLNVGLSMAIVERVKWEQERGGFKWVGLRNFEDQKERVRKTEEFRGRNEWRKFGCYVLVERFVLKRMDGTLLLTWDFKHTHQITTKWE